MRSDPKLDSNQRPNRSETKVASAPWSGADSPCFFLRKARLLPPLAALVVVAVGSAAVRIRPWICFEKFRTKEKLQHLYDAGVLGGRGWITQAAHRKRPRRGLFAAGTYSGGRCCSNPPAIMSLMFMQKKTASVSLHQRFFHGAKQPKSEPLPSGASLAAISSKVMVFLSLIHI